jgi:hypothetical protein
LAGRDIVTVGASSGEVEALMRVVGGLPRILDRAGPLEAVHPEDGEPIKSGRIYVAPPDVHLLVQKGRVRLARGPKENLHRPHRRTPSELPRTAAVRRGPGTGVQTGDAPRRGEMARSVYADCTLRLITRGR